MNTNTQYKALLKIERDTRIMRKYQGGMCPESGQMYFINHIKNFDKTFFKILDIARELINSDFSENKEYKERIYKCVKQAYMLRIWLFWSSRFWQHPIISLWLNYRVIK